MILKRTKTIVGPEPEKRVITAIHFAAKVDARGNVTVWDSNPANACPIDETTAALIGKAYEKRKDRCGKFELVKGDGKAPPKVEPTSDMKSENDRLAAALKEGAEKHAKLAKEKADIAAERDLLREENERLKKAAEASEPTK